MDPHRLWLVVNGASGSNAADALALLDASLAGAGMAPARRFDVQDGTLPDRAALEAEGVGRLAIFAGDGTVNTLVTALGGWAGEVLVLPGGTANLLAHALHGEREVADILSDPARLRPVRRTCIRCAHGTALIEALAGPGAAWSDVREGLREGSVAEVARLALDAVVQSVAGPMVAIVDPPLGREDGYAGVRMAPDGAAMLVSGYGAENAADYFRQGVALLRRDFREGPHDELGAQAALTCRSLGDGPIELMLDGERRTGGREERFSLAELPVNLLATA